MHRIYLLHWLFSLTWQVRFLDFKRVTLAERKQARSFVKHLAPLPNDKTGQAKNQQQAKQQRPGGANTTQVKTFTPGAPIGQNASVVAANGDSVESTTETANKSNKTSPGASNQQQPQKEYPQATMPAGVKRAMLSKCCGRTNYFGNLTSPVVFVLSSCLVPRCLCRTQAVNTLKSYLLLPVVSTLVCCPQVAETIRTCWPFKTPSSEPRRWTRWNDCTRCWAVASLPDSPLTGTNSRSAKCQSNPHTRPPILPIPPRVQSFPPACLSVSYVQRFEPEANDTLH